MSFCDVAVNVVAVPTTTSNEATSLVSEDTTFGAADSTAATGRFDESKHSVDIVSQSQDAW